MNNPVFFSIVVPTYDRARRILPTIESILSQTYKNFELIIVDDGSKDNTEEVIQKFLADNVRYYKNENAERGAARNFGTMKAKGDYINWFDSDDIMYTDHLEQAATGISRNNSPCVFSTGFEYMDDAGAVFYRSHYSSNVNQDLYKGNPFSVDTVFVRKDIAISNPYNEDRELSGSEDYELWLRLAARYPIYTSPVITTGFIHHKERSTIVMSRPELLVNRFIKLNAYAAADPDVVALLGRNKGFFEMKNFLLLSVDLASKGHLGPGLKYLIKGFTSSPRIIFERSFYAFIKHFIRHSLS